MAKDAERQTAQIMYIDQCLTAKEISARIGVAQKTVGIWVEQGRWKELRSAKQTSSHSIVGKYNELLELLINKRLDIEKKKDRTEDDEAMLRGTIDEMSKISAMIDRVQKDGRVSLRVHIHCLEKFMGFLQQKDSRLHNATIDIQQEYLPILAEELNNA